MKHIGDEYSPFIYEENGGTRRELLARSHYAHCTNHPRNEHPYRSRDEMPKVTVMDAARWSHVTHYLSIDCKTVYPIWDILFYNILNFI